MAPSADMFSSSFTKTRDGGTKAGLGGCVEVLDICICRQKQGG